MSSLWQWIRREILLKPEVMQLIFLTGVLVLLVRGCGDTGPDKTQVDADSLRAHAALLVRTVRLDSARIAAALSAHRIDSLRADSLEGALQKRGTRLAVRLDSLRPDTGVSRDSVSMALYSKLWFAADTLRHDLDTTLAGWTKTRHDADSVAAMLHVAQADLGLLQTQNADLVRSNTNLSADVDKWRKRATGWHPCYGTGGALVPANGNLNTGPALFAGFCRSF